MKIQIAKQKGDTVWFKVLDEGVTKIKVEDPESGKEVFWDKKNCEFAYFQAFDLKPDLEALIQEMSEQPLQLLPQEDSAATVEDVINKPNHYHVGGFDIYEIMQAKLTPEEYQGFCKGNILKYTLREALKGGLQDLKKARFNSDRLIESREGKKYIPEHKKKE